MADDKQRPEQPDLPADGPRPAEPPSDATHALPDGVEPLPDPDGPLPPHSVAPPETAVAASPTAGAVRTGRAGRNLPAAIGVGVGLAGLLVASLYLYRPAFVVLVGAAVLLGVWELRAAFATAGRSLPVAPVAAGGVAMLVLAYLQGGEGLVLALFATVVAVLVWRLPERRPAMSDAVAGVFTALYVPFLAAFAVLLAVPDDGAHRVLVFLGTVVANDTGGYAAGVLLGRHPLAPRISPKKTWEGLAGSLLACMAVAAAGIVLLLDGELWHGAVLGATLAITATVGDLGESAIKRDLGLKDMSHLLPGHGGVMDRLDSMLPSAPVAWLLLGVLVPA